MPQVLVGGRRGRRRGKRTLVFGDYSPWLVIAAVSIVLSTSCGEFVGGTDKAQHGVDGFHAFYNARQFDTIYRGADGDFRASVTNAQLQRLLETSRTHLGKQLASTPVVISYQSFNLRSYVTASTVTTYEHGKGTETFVFSLSNGKAVLHGYNLDSTDLILLNKGVVTL